MAVLMGCICWPLCCAPSLGFLRQLLHGDIETFCTVLFRVQGLGLRVQGLGFRV